MGTILTKGDYIILYDDESVNVITESHYYDRAEKDIVYANASFNETKSYRHPIIAYYKLNDAADDLIGALRVNNEKELYNRI